MLVIGTLDDFRFILRGGGGEGRQPIVIDLSFKITWKVIILDDCNVIRKEIIIFKKYDSYSSTYKSKISPPTI